LESLKARWVRAARSAGSPETSVGELNAFLQPDARQPAHLLEVTTIHQFSRRVIEVGGIEREASLERESLATN